MDRTAALELNTHTHIYKYIYICVCVYAQLLQSRLFATPWTVAYLASLSMGFSWQEYWSGLPCPSPGDLPDPRIKPTAPISPILHMDYLPLSHQVIKYIQIIHTHIHTHTYISLSHRRHFLMEEKPFKLRFLLSELLWNNNNIMHVESSGIKLPLFIWLILISKMWHFKIKGRYLWLNSRRREKSLSR